MSNTDETRSILTTFTGLGQELSLAIPQSRTLEFVSSGNGQGRLIPMQQSTTIHTSAGTSRPPFSSTLSSLMASLPHPEQLDTNTSSMATALESSNFFELTPGSLQTAYGSFEQMQMHGIDSGLADIGDLDDLLAQSSNPLGQELTRLLGDAAELLRNSNDQSYAGSPGSISTLATDFELNTLFSEFQPSPPSSGSASGTATPQQTQIKHRSILPAHKKWRRDLPSKRTVPRRRAARAADKENAVTE